MITITNDEPLQWQKLKSFGVLASVDGLEHFKARFEGNYGRALQKVQCPYGFSPPADVIAEVHAALFVGILHSAGAFRDNSRPALAQEGHELCASREVEARLNKIAEPVKFLTLEANPDIQVKRIAKYHAEFMKLEPFAELSNSKFVNRAVAFTILEGQLEHCFNARRINRVIDGSKWREALHHHVDLAAPARLEQLVKEMAGKKMSISLSPHAGPELDRDR